MSGDRSSSTRRLLELCGGYFAAYVVTGVCVKLFVGKTALAVPPMADMTFLVYSTVGGTLLTTSVAIAAGWLKLPLGSPRALWYILPSGVCTAVVIPTTTLLYSFPMSVMVAMVIMRGSVIVISRAVDAVQSAQGLLRKRVHPAENMAVVFALLGVGVHLVDRSGAIVIPPEALLVLASYIVAYALRIYIMNYFKNTSVGSAPRDNRAFFAYEQLSAAATMLLGFAAAYVLAPTSDGRVLHELRAAVEAPHRAWLAASASGLAYGMVGFFSVFIFMFKGRTATFAGLVNRLTSLVAGTTATLIVAAFFGGRWPGSADWISLGFILAAVACLVHAERANASARAVKQLEVRAVSETTPRVG